LIKHLKRGTVPGDATVVCVLTGNGLKDPDTPLKVSKPDLSPVPATFQALKEALRL
jgi:threonine synthase